MPPHTKPDDRPVVRFAAAHLSGKAPCSEVIGVSGYLKEVNIKSDMPAAQDAVKRVTFNIENGKRTGCAALKIIHGYGSTGRGGKIRSEVRAYLSRLKQQRRIRDFITGEDFSIFDQATRDAFLVCGDLRGDRDLERHNNGVTIVIL